MRKEKEDAKALLDKIPSNYYGKLTHDLSLNYIDNVIKYLYESLEKEGMLDNTCITICADHGFSFSGNPVRDTFVNNFYLENYNIPCVITGAGYEGLSIEKLCTSKDLPATICELATGSVPKEFTGHSILSDYEYDSVDIEYCGGGCPDLLRKELKIASFDKDYFVGTLCKLDDDINEDTITEVYNLKDDPIQLNNLVGKIKDYSAYKKYIDAIIKRKNEIKRTM